MHFYRILFVSLLVLVVHMLCLSECSHDPNNVFKPREDEYGIDDLEKFLEGKLLSMDSTNPRNKFITDLYLHSLGRLIRDKYFKDEQSANDRVASTQETLAEENNEFKYDNSANDDSHDDGDYDDAELDKNEVEYAKPRTFKRPKAQYESHAMNTYPYQSPTMQYNPNANLYNHALRNPIPSQYMRPSFQTGQAPIYYSQPSYVSNIQHTQQSPYLSAESPNQYLPGQTYQDSILLMAANSLKQQQQQPFMQASQPKSLMLSLNQQRMPRVNPALLEPALSRIQAQPKNLLGLMRAKTLAANNQVNQQAPEQREASITINKPLSIERIFQTSKSISKRNRDLRDRLTSTSTSNNLSLTIPKSSSTSTTSIKFFT